MRADTLEKDSRLASPRLTYRGISEEDAALIVSWRSDPENYRFFLDPRPITLEEHMKWYARYREDETRYDFIIKEDGHPIGIVGLSHIDSDSCEINYIIGDKGARGKGYAKEAVRAMCDAAFDSLGVRHIDARIVPGNEASLKVLLAVGFKGQGGCYRLERAQ